MGVKLRLIMAHEDLKREHEVERSSDRSFGVVFAIVFLIIAGWPMLHGEAWRRWALAVAAVFGVIALLKPALLAGLSRQWMKLGIFLGKVVSPIALGVLFYGIITPIGALMRLAGQDPLRLKFDRAADTYWIRREPPGPPPDSMKNQF